MIRQQILSRDEETLDSENTAGSKQISQHKVSRYGETCASDNESRY